MFGGDLTNSGFGGNGFDSTGMGGFNNGGMNGFNNGGMNGFNSGFNNGFDNNGMMGKRSVDEIEKKMIPEQKVEKKAVEAKGATKDKKIKISKNPIVEKISISN